MDCDAQMLLKFKGMIEIYKHKYYVRQVSKKLERLLIISDVSPN